jgi:hypothetical protein
MIFLYPQNRVYKGLIQGKSIKINKLIPNLKKCIKRVKPLGISDIMVVKKNNQKTLNKGGFTCGYYTTKKVV